MLRPVQTPKNPSLSNYCGLAAIAAAYLFFTCDSQAVSILPGATIVKSTNAPLAAKLLFNTDVPSRVSVSMTNDSDGWTLHFYDYATNHTVFLYGFKPSQTNLINFTAIDSYRNSATNAQALTFVTSPLPSDFPKLTLLTNVPSRMEPGYTLFRVVNQNNNRAYLAIIDSSANVLWYSSRQSTADLRQLANGNLFIPLTTSFVEFNLFGDVVNTWNTPLNYSVDIHDGVPTDHGTILYLSNWSRGIPNFPTSSTDPTAPPEDAVVMYNRVVEISSTNSNLLHSWSPIDKLDPRRIDYLTFLTPSALGIDCEHANALIEDPRDDSIIVSMRNQDAVIKFARSTGELIWILGPHENWGPQWQPYLLTPVGSPFQWQYGQHAPVITPQGTLLLYDDGNFRASPFDASVADQDNYSRAVEYDINEAAMEVSQVWDYGRTNGERLYTDRVGNADWLPQQQNVLINYGYVQYDNGVHPSPFSTNATMLRIQEVTHDTSEIVFDLACFDYTNSLPTYRGTSGYRSHRIADLYGHLARPVQDLVIFYENGEASLLFSGDPTRTYTIEGSSDLVTWMEIGVPEVQGNGDYTFQDMDMNAGPTQFYRVVTH